MKAAHQQFVEFLLKWNKKMNLTAITDPDDIRRKHVEDSLSLLPFLADAKRLIDLGSGAGFPGIPLKIECPSLEITLVEATRKKTSFLLSAIAHLGLEGIRVVHGRAESPALIAELGQFDVVASRATWSLDALLPLAAPYCRIGGRIIAMKGPKWEQELDACALLPELQQFEQPCVAPSSVESGEKHVLVLFQKKR